MRGGGAVAASVFWSGAAVGSVSEIPWGAGGDEVAASPACGAAGLDCWFPCDAGSAVLFVVSALGAAASADVVVGSAGVAAS